MAVTATLSWTPVPGSYGTRVEYKKSSDSIWILPNSPDNPTLFSTYPISIDEGEYYDIKLTTLSNACAEKSVIKKIISNSSNCCPPTYNLNDDESLCYKVEEVAATPPSGSPETTITKVNAAYTTCGSFIYDPGWGSNGVGSSTQISLSNGFWKNGGVCVDNNTTDGPLNRTGLWTTTETSNQDIGFSVCLTILTDKTYYIGVGCDNNAIIRLDGTTIITQDASALDAHYSVGGSCFKIWHIYPVDLTVGPHIIELIGHNVSGAAALGAEVYDNTSAEIAAATTYGGLNLVFSTKDMRGEEIQIGTGGVGYTCPSGYSLSACDDPIKCKKITTTAIIPC